MTREERLARYAEGKRRYHARRAERKAKSLESKPMTDEKLERHVEGVMMMVRGFFLLAGIDIDRMVERDEFPAELEVNDDF